MINVNYINMFVNKHFARFNDFIKKKKQYKCKCLMAREISLIYFCIDITIKFMQWNCRTM